MSTMHLTSSAMEFLLSLRRLRSALTLQQLLDDHEQGQGHSHHDRGNDVDLRCDAAPDCEEESYAQGGERPGHEESDHEIIKAEGEAEEEAGQDRGQKLGQRDLDK